MAQIECGFPDPSGKAAGLHHIRDGKGAWLVAPADHASDRQQYTDNGTADHGGHHDMQGRQACGGGSDLLVRCSEEEHFARHDGEAENDDRNADQQSDASRNQPEPQGDLPVLANTH